VIYFATGTDTVLKEAVEERSDLGILTTYNGNNTLGYPVGTLFAADNGCFGKRWDEAGWRRYVERHAERVGKQTIWATCPDVVGDHLSTLERWEKYSGWIRDCGLQPAFVLQNGCTSWKEVPEDALALFIGGDDAYKLGDDVKELVKNITPNHWLHMGRVNSLKRTVYAASIGCHSVDGTFVSFGPKVNLPKVCNWLNVVNKG
jgi:hypothetical protein